MSGDNETKVAGDNAALAAANVMLTRIQASRKVAEADLRKFRRRSKGFTYASVVCSALASLLAGFAAANGPAFGEGAPAWQMTCGVVACFTAGAGILAGVQQAGDFTSELAKASANASRLAGLELGITVIQRDPVELAKDYEELVLQNPHLFVVKPVTSEPLAVKAGAN